MEIDPQKYDFSVDGYIEACKGMVGVGIAGNDHQKADSITSVDFSIPIKLPYDTGNEGVVYSR